jgi:pimeloyl-ACP methyl ester carboxylesterase
VGVCSSGGGTGASASRDGLGCSAGTGEGRVPLGLVWARLWVDRYTCCDRSFHATTGISKTHWRVMTKAVVLIHGLMMKSFVMQSLRISMRKAGFNVYLFDYKSHQYSAKTLSNLHALVQAIGDDDIYFVGHSMGGLVARNYVTAHHSPKFQGLVTIATPHNQSLSAHAASRSIFKRFIGTAGDSGLTRDLPAWDNSIPMGCIAGLSTSKLSNNLFLLLTHKKAPSDGTVFLDEAVAMNCKDHIVMSGSHTGLLFRKDVARQCIHFFENKKFAVPS